MTHHRHDANAEYGMTHMQVEVDGVRRWYARPPHDGPEPCVECGAPHGRLHFGGCSLEPCNICGLQFGEGCECRPTAITGSRYACGCETFEDPPILIAGYADDLDDEDDDVTDAP